MKNKTNKVSVILKIIATFCVIPLIFSSFASGFNIVGNTTTSVSMFEFTQRTNVFLAEAFVCMVLQVLVILFLTFYGVVQTTKVKKEKLIGICLSVAEFALAVLSFICVLIYCKAFNGGENYVIGASPICFLIFGTLFSGFMIASYVVPDKPVKKSKTTTKAKQVKN